MSEIFTIDTEEGIVKEKEEVVEPLSLFDDRSSNASSKNT
jgi:hypothetical protein